MNSLIKTILDKYQVRKSYKDKSRFIELLTEYFNNNNIKYDIDSVIKEQLEIDNDFVNEIVNGVVFKKDDIDLLANKYLNKWRIDRLGLTDQAILRMGIYELVYTDTPDLVCINEAIELAKQYSDEKVSKMINGVLDKIYNSRLNNE